MSNDEKKIENNEVSAEAVETGAEMAAKEPEKAIEAKAELEVKAATSKPEEKSEEAEKVPSMDDFKDEIDASLKKIKKGETVKCRVESVTENEIVVSFDYSADGVISKDQLVLNKDEAIADKYAIGDELTCLVVKTSDKNGNVVLSHVKAQMTVAWDELEKKFNEKEQFAVKIAEVVKGGMIARINGVRAFMPASMASNRYVEDLNDFVGKELVVEIKDFEREARKVIISHKEIAAKLAEKAKTDFFANVQLNDEFKGKVKKLMNFGAFVDLGGTDGLLHINEMSWKRLKHPSEVVKEGDLVEVVVISVDKEKGKVSLKLKNIEGNPWDEIDSKYSVGEIYEGEVMRLADFGAFVRLEEGVEGLVHISEISYKHIDTPASVLKVGEKVNVKVLSIDASKQKIGLSIKMTQEDTREPREPRAPRKKKEDDVAAYNTDEKATTSLASVFKDIKIDVE